ncbi:uncharacterized protein EI90DRAFT_3018304 [Cantharellus anzutake]|uniref:uncharacterized protein n=1 Tax=Cantharellus anzutake TaxID=1750568 RepID=UPI001905F4D9|nr:uncharacterized protein EI90DRAFT_3018304 [Cantharellus anzutake]KAF8327248.1 hypothetical protein EI90DRAFT_3018304 [Cantharellus anzutake]
MSSSQQEVNPKFKHLLLKACIKQEHLTQIQFKELESIFLSVHWMLSTYGLLRFPPTTHPIQPIPKKSAILIHLEPPNTGHCNPKASVTRDRLLVVPVQYPTPSPSPQTPSSSLTTQGGFDALGKSSFHGVKDALQALIIATGLVGTIASASYYGLRRQQASKLCQNSLNLCVNPYVSRDEYEATRPSGNPRVDAVEDRLRQAYLDGGLTRWGDQIWKELEGELEESNRSKG